MDGAVSEVPTFGEDEIAEARGHLDDLFDGIISDEATVGEVEDSEGFVGTVWRELKECRIGNQVAVGKADFAEVTEVGKEGYNSGIGNLVTFEEIYLQQVRAILGERKDGIVGYLITLVQFQL